MLTISLCKLLVDNLPVEQIDPRQNGRNAIVVNQMMFDALENRLELMIDKSNYKIQVSENHQLENNHQPPHIWMFNINDQTESMETVLVNNVSSMKDKTLFAVVIQTSDHENVVTSLISALSSQKIFEIWLVQDEDSEKKCVIGIGCAESSPTLTQCFMFRSIRTGVEPTVFIIDSTSLMFFDGKDDREVKTQNLNHLHSKINESARIWKTGGVVKSVDGKDGTITFWLRDFDDLQTVTITRNMPGWLLQPSVSFETELPEKQAFSEEMDDVVWGKFRPGMYTYFTEEELDEVIYQTFLERSVSSQNQIRTYP